MAYSTHKTAIPPPPSPSPYSRLPTPAGSHFGRPGVSRSASNSTYSSSHPSPSRPNLSHQSSSYDSFAPQACPTPSPSKLPGLGLQRPGSTVDGGHKRRGSVAEKARLFEKTDDIIPRSPSTLSGFGYGSNSRLPGGTRRESVSNGLMASPRSNRTTSRPPSYVDSNNDRDVFSDIGNTVSDNRQSVSHAMNLASQNPMKNAAQDYGSHASPASMRKSLGLLGGQSDPVQVKENIHQIEDMQRMPPPPTINRQLQVSENPNEKFRRHAPAQTSMKPPSPPTQAPTPSPRKGTHVRAQSHVVTSLARPPPRPTSTRPLDSRPTSTVGSKATGPVRPVSTLHSAPSARPRAASHNHATGPEARRISTPANDLPLPRGSRAGVGRTIAPPRSTSTRPNEPVASSSASLRRPTGTTTRPRPPSSHLPSTAASKGSDSELSIRSESVASTTSNSSSVRSDVTMKPKPLGRATTVNNRQEPQSPQRSSPTKGHKKNASVSQTGKPSRPAFNTFKVEYPQAGTTTSKPTTSSLMQSMHAPLAQQIDTIHAQTRLLQFSILHAQSFASTAQLKNSAHKQLYERFSDIRERNLQVSESHRREQELVDLYALSLVLKRPAVSSSVVGNWKDKLSGSPDEAIQSLSEQLTKVLAWFAEGKFEGEYTSMIRKFEEWVALPDTHEKKIEGLGTEYGRDVIRVRRKMEMALRGLEGWMVLIVDGEKGESGEDIPALRSSLGRILSVAVGRLKSGLNELNAIQNVEKTVVTTIRKELKKKLGNILENRRETNVDQQKKELASWQPIWVS